MNWVSFIILVSILYLINCKIKIEWKIIKLKVKLFYTFGLVALILIYAEETSRHIQTVLLYDMFIIKIRGSE